MSYLNLLKRRFLCLTVQINIIKGYLYSKLIYQAPVLTITKELVKKIYNIINWFLYHKDRNTLRYDPIKKYYCAISIKRLSYSKKNGGRNLYNIKEIFGAAKSKTIIVLTREENKDNSCAILLNNLLDNSFESQNNYPNNCTLLPIETRTRNKIFLIKNSKNVKKQILINFILLSIYIF